MALLEVIDLSRLGVIGDPPSVSRVTGIGIPPLLNNQWSLALRRQVKLIEIDMKHVAVARSRLRSIDHFRSVRSPVERSHMSIGRGHALGRSSLYGHPIEPCVRVSLVCHDRIVTLVDPFPFFRGERIDGQITHLPAVRGPLEVADTGG